MNGYDSFARTMVDYKRLPALKICVMIRAAGTKIKKFCIRVKTESIKNEKHETNYMILRFFAAVLARWCCKGGGNRLILTNLSGILPLTPDLDNLLNGFNKRTN